MLFNAHIISLGRGGGTAGRQVEPLMIMITRIMLVTLLVYIYSLQGQTQQIL